MDKVLTRKSSILNLVLQLSTQKKRKKERKMERHIQGRTDKYVQHSTEREREIERDLVKTTNIIEPNLSEMLISDRKTTTAALGPPL